jgi:hypothetical protein
MSELDPQGLMAAPSLSEAARAVFSDEECNTLRDNLHSEQIAQARYLRAHPEIRESLQEGLRRVLQSQPADPVAALVAYFSSEEFTHFHGSSDKEGA